MSVLQRQQNEKVRRTSVREYLVAILDGFVLHHMSLDCPSFTHLDCWSIDMRELGCVQMSLLALCWTIIGSVLWYQNGWH